MVKPKFKKGDKVRLVKKIHYIENGKDARITLTKGDVYTIDCFQYFNTLHQYTYEVKESVYLLVEDEIELAAKPETIHLSFDIPANDKKAAHKTAHIAVENALREHAEAKMPAYENWTEEEIRKAQDAIAKLVHYVIMNGGDISWSKDNRGNIWCRHSRNMYDPFNQANKGMAKKMPEDTYNEWIGKYVSLCHALDFPLPDFIRFKNVKQ